jgi:Bacterial Ig-like domain (group 3)
MHSLLRRTGGFGRLAAAAVAVAAGAVLPAAGLWAGTASAITASVTSISSSPNPSFYGEAVTFTATVSPTDGLGTVTFKTGGTGGTAISGCSTLSLALVSGTYTASCTTTSLAPGSQLIGVTYTGDVSYGASSDETTQLVLRDPTRMHTKIMFNDSQTFTVEASLYSSHTPLAGRGIRFSAAHIFLCAATTDSKGIATCVLTYAESVIIARNDGRYLAKFGGNVDYSPSSAAGTGVLLP